MKDPLSIITKAEKFSIAITQLTAKDGDLGGKIEDLEAQIDAAIEERTAVQEELAQQENEFDTFLGELPEGLTPEKVREIAEVRTKQLAEAGLLGEVDVKAKPAPKKPRKKRRTKAEIQADAEAEAARTAALATAATGDEVETTSEEASDAATVTNEAPVDTSSEETANVDETVSEAAPADEAPDQIEAETETTAPEVDVETAEDDVASSKETDDANSDESEASDQDDGGATGKDDGPISDEEMRKLVDSNFDEDFDEEKLISALSGEEADEPENDDDFNVEVPAFI